MDGVQASRRKLESTNSHEEAWLDGVRSLKAPNGVFDQISGSVHRLDAKLKPQTGHRKALQTLKWPLIDKKDAEETVSQIERLKLSVSLLLNHASLAIGTKVNDLETQSVLRLITSLVKQDIQQRSVVDKRLGELHEAHYKKESRLTPEEFKELLGNAISHYVKTSIVLDALDEMLDEKCRSDLVNCLRAFRQKSN